MIEPITAGGPPARREPATHECSARHHLEISDEETSILLPLDLGRAPVLRVRFHGETCAGCAPSAAAPAASAGSPPASAPAEDLADKLAAALREVRGYVPDRVWWDAGAAHALFEYEAKRGR